MAKRKYIPLKTKLAAALIELFKLPREQARHWTPEYVLGLVDWNHIVLHAWTEDDHHANLEPLLRLDHRATVPGAIKAAAKTRRITKKEEEFRRRLLAKAAGELVEKRKKHKWAPRKMTSRPFDKSLPKR